MNWNLPCFVSSYYVGVYHHPHQKKYQQCMFLSTYNNVVISDQTSHSETDDILIKIGLHQGLAFNPYLFFLSDGWGQEGINDKNMPLGVWWWSAILWRLRVLRKLELWLHSLWSNGLDLVRLRLNTWGVTPNLLNMIKEMLAWRIMWCLRRYFLIYIWIRFYLEIEISMKMLAM